MDIKGDPIILRSAPDAHKVVARQHLLAILTLPRL